MTAEPMRGARRRANVAKLRRCSSAIMWRAGTRRSRRPPSAFQLRHRRRGRPRVHPLVGLRLPGARTGRHHGRLPRRREGRAADAARARAGDRRLRAPSAASACASIPASTRRASRPTPATTSPASAPTTISSATRSRRASGAASCATGEPFLRIVAGRRRPPEGDGGAGARAGRARRCPRAALDLHQDNFIHGVALLRLRVRRSRRLPAAAGALGRAGAGPAQQHRRFGARAGQRRARRRRGVHRLPRRQHHRPLPPRRRPLHGGDRDHHRDARPRWPTRSTSSGSRGFIDLAAAAG